MTDPTLRILATLDDPDRYTRERGVPVFVPHKRSDPVLDDDGEPVLDDDGNPVENEIEVTIEDLEEIAESINHKVEEYGTPVRITRGHVVLPRKGEPAPSEDKQPPIWGWGKNARVGTWGPKKKVGLLIDQYIRNEHHEEAMGYPFRSGEYYPSTNEITGVALLRRDPELDMGLVTYARRGTPEQGKPEVTMPNPEDDFLDDVDDGQEQYADEPDGDEGDFNDGPEGDEYSPEEAEQYARMHRYNAQRAEELLAEMGDDDEDRPQMEQMARCYGRMAYGAGEPAGGNAFVPGDGLDEPPMDPLGDEEMDEEPEMEQMGRGGKPKSRQYGRQRPTRQSARQDVTQQQYAKLEQQVQELKKDRAMLQYERHLDSLDRAGVIFDMDQEIADARDMTAEQRKRQLQKMARHYARSPVGGGLVATDFDEVENNRQRPLTAAQKAAAVRYAQRNGVTYEQAMVWARQNA